MRRMLGVIGVTFAACSTLVLASAPAAGLRGAFVEKGGRCFALAPLTGVDLVTFDSTQVETSQNAVLTCHFRYPAGSEPAAGFRASGFGCAIHEAEIVTFDTHFVATASGQATLICHFRDF
jgi:hypothetical protein